jgi:hypothetical protein
MPAASSGASSRLSAASTASLRTAVIRTLIETEPSLRASRDPRQAFTVAFVNPGQLSRNLCIAGSRDLWNNQMKARPLRRFGQRSDLLWRRFLVPGTFRNGPPIAKLAENTPSVP